MSKDSYLSRIATARSTKSSRTSQDACAQVDRMAKSTSEKLATISIAEFDAETRFRAIAARGSAKQGLAVLDQLAAAFKV